MRKNNSLTFSLSMFAFAAGLFFTSCSPAGDNHTGHEFMPDMAHSVAYEGNVFFEYGPNTWEDESVLKRKSLGAPRLPIAGTIARGFAGTSSMNAEALNGSFNKNAIYTPANGSVPYYYGNTEEERTRAMADIVTNPFTVTPAGLVRGKELYTIYCGLCHGDKGDGGGYLVREDGGVYPAVPANLISEEFVAASEGRFYHSIMYGKNVMGSYADKLSYEERWQVIHYIRSLQGATASTTTNETDTTMISAAPPAGGAEQIQGAQ